MAETHPLAEEVARLNEIEQRAIDRFIHRQRLAHQVRASSPTLGDRVADRVASFGGSWKFISLALGGIAIWMLVNALVRRPFDPYPYILLNLVLSCLAGLQAPIIMMSQNRQAARDRIDAQHDYEINTKAELEILALHAKLDEIRDEKWVDLIRIQGEQLALLKQITSRP